MSKAKVDHSNYDVNGVPLEGGMIVVLTGKNWAHEGVQGELREVRLQTRRNGSDFVVQVKPGVSPWTLFITGTPGRWDDWTVTKAEKSEAVAVPAATV